MTSTRRARRGARNDGRRALRASALGGLAALALAGAGAAPALAGISELPSGSRIAVDTGVGAMAVHGDTLYIAGDPSTGMTSLGLRAPGLAILDATSGTLDRATPELLAGATVRALAPDGQGGAYVAGDLDGTAGVRQADLLHVRADGTVDRAFRPRFGGFSFEFGGRDETLAVRLTDLERADDGTLYVAGDFARVNGRPHPGVAALDPATGAPSEWRPTLELDPTGRNSPIVAHPWVRDVALGAGGTLYLTGDFSAVGAGAERVERAGAAQVSRADGRPTAWDPGDGFAEGENENPRAAGVVASGDRVYLHGEFTVAGHGAPADHLVAVDAASGERVEGFAPAPDGPVRSLVVSDDGATVYVGGAFTQAGGASRSGLAALSAADGTATAWAPELSGPIAVLGLELEGDTLRAVGRFDRVDGEVRCNAAAIGTGADAPLRDWDPALDIAADWDCINSDGSYPQAANVVRTIDGRTWVGGSFTQANRERRAGLAAIDVSEDRILPWRPTVDNEFGAGLGTTRVMEVAKDGQTVYLGGAFVAVNGAPRANLAAVAATGAANQAADVRAWDPSPTAEQEWLQPVSALALDARPGSTVVYVGGNFTTVGAGAGTPRERLAAFDPVAQPDGAPTSWNPGADGEVTGLDVARDGTVFAAGRFRTLGGAGRAYVGALTPDGAVTGWDPGLPQGSDPGNSSFARDVALDERDGAPASVYAVVDAEDGWGDRARLRAWSLPGMTPRAGVPETGGVDGSIYDIDVDADGGVLVRGGASAARLSDAGQPTWQVEAGSVWERSPIGAVDGTVFVANAGAGSGLAAFAEALAPAMQTQPRVSSLTRDGEERVVDGGIVADAAGTPLACVPADAVADGEPAARSYAWLFDGVVQEGLTRRTIRLDQADVSVSCRETLRAAADAVVVQESAPVLVVSRAPENDGVLPELSGAVQVESSVRCTTGGWTAGGRVAGYRYRWLLGGQPIAGQSTRDYVPVAGDVGKALSCEVTASNGAGESAPARSAAKTVAAKPENREPENREPENRQPENRQPETRQPPVEQPPVQQPPVENPPRAVARPVVRKVSYSPKRGGRVTVGVRVPGAGTLRVTVRVRVGRRAVVVASGSLKVRKAGTVTLKLRPSKAGRKALRRARGRRLVAVAVFTAARR